ncbi:MAG: hypothetical protein K8F36_11960 [Melioribacteraceae bacterium]|nr:hypothetical protein [Melioribacteraceae bacterium]
MKGQREYYRHAAVYPEVSGKIPPRQDNLVLDEHKYLLQVQSSKYKDKSVEKNTSVIFTRRSENEGGLNGAQRMNAEGIAM